MVFLFRKGVINMIDFQNKKLFKLVAEDLSKGEKIIGPYMVPGEEIIDSYVSIRDHLVFTNKRIVAVNVEGITGKKKDFSFIPYSCIQTFSLETAGVLDLDAHLHLYINSIGMVCFELSGSSNVTDLCVAIGEYILK